MTRDIAAMFINAAKKYPDNTAVVHNGNAVSYSELMRRVIHLVGLLGECGENVGVVTSHSLNNIIALLSVLVAGKTYCPIGSEYPLTQQCALIKEADCSTILFTDNSVAGDNVKNVNASLLAGCEPCIRSINIPAIEAILKEEGESTSEQNSIADNCINPAYILFTSGSTGKPKPVITPRLGISTVTVELIKLFGITPGERILQFASLNWDTCFEEIFPALTTGATLVINDEAYRGSMSRLLRLIDDARVNVLNLPTAFWHELVYFLRETKTLIPDCVHTLIIGGEPVQTARLSDWVSLDTSHIRLINTYGSTETTLITHAIDLHGPRSELDVSWNTADGVPIGRCLAHVVESVSNQEELLIGGPALAIGYKNLPAETKERFVEDEEQSGRGRYYRTGDRVRRDASGILYHLGRLDNQLKIRGIRVEPGAVEAEVLKVSGVSMVAVIGDKIANHTRLVAYVLPRCFENVQLLTEQIFAYLRCNAPEYLIPAVIRIVSNFHFTSTGKVDRMAIHNNYLTTLNTKESVQ